MLYILLLILCINKTIEMALHHICPFAVLGRRGFENMDLLHASLFLVSHSKTLHITGMYLIYLYIKALQ